MSLEDAIEQAIESVRAIFHEEKFNRDDTRTALETVATVIEEMLEDLDE